MSMSFVDVLEMKKIEILRSGETIGPFHFKRLRQKRSEGLEITLFDIVGETYHIEVDANPITLRIQPSPNPLFANCVVLLGSEVMQILMTKDVVGNVPLFATLIAEKFLNPTTQQRKFECSKCHKASFSTMETLKTHEELYCDRREMEVTSTAADDARPNLLLLPLAYHDLAKPNAIQILGPMHSILPVAISRNDSSSTFTTTPLTLTTNLPSVPSTLSIALPQLSISIPISTIGGMTDLTRPTTSSSGSSSPQSKSSEPEKPFPCTCGVSFSNEQTYDAHRNFYCRNAPPNAKTANELNNKRLAERCGQCDFQPQSPAQLALHIRSAHQTTRTFICHVCRYRAFSMRGIRTHMRSHSPDSALKFESK